MKDIKIEKIKEYLKIRKLSKENKSLELLKKAYDSLDNKKEENKPNDKR